MTRSGRSLFGQKEPIVLGKKEYDCLFVRQVALWRDADQKIGPALSDTYLTVALRPNLQFVALPTLVVGGVEGFDQFSVEVVTYSVSNDEFICYTVKDHTVPEYFADNSHLSAESALRFAEEKSPQLQEYYEEHGREVSGYTRDEILSEVRKR